ncbi:MAG: class I SAM-dependent methyltransferase [Ruminococcus sp.]|nr:class I SAM-dependent methyltransferase [Ruminococcus sp.]MDE6785049.1 class I SAM-dependent methyltransferase [Ruminococcus sp.]
MFFAILNVPFESSIAILPIVINSDGVDYTDQIYKRIRFYLGRLNMIFLNKFSSKEALVLKIFEQTGFEINNEELKESLYHASESESLRLKAQNDIMLNFSKEYFDIAVSSESRILDVGCANGNYIMSHLESREYRSLLGIDIDSEQIEQANQTYESEKNTFFACDALSNEFDSILSDYLEENEALGFDLIHISAMLLHLVNPVKLLQTLRRYLKKTDDYLFKTKTMVLILYIQIRGFMI